MPAPLTSSARATATRPSLAGVGYSEDAHSRRAAAEAATQALARAGADSCDLAIVFGTGKHDPASLLEGLRSVIGPTARVFGGAADGVITNDRLGYDGHQVAVATLRSDALKVDMFL